MKNIKKYKNLAGYSFIEVIIGISIFSIVVLTAVSVFSTSSSSYRRTRDVQRDMEAVQQAMSLMAKTIKTGKIAGVAGAENNIKLYDSSQEKCIQYSFAGNNLEYNEITGATESTDCGGGGYSAPSNMIEGVAGLQFNKIIPVVGANIGKVTIAMKICPDPAAGCSGQDTVYIQTTVSSRDYEEAEI